VPQIRPDPHARPIRRRLTFGILAIASTVCAAACAPVVTHGPRVEGGTFIVVTGGGAVSACDSLTCDLEMLPQAALGVRTGRAASETRPGLSVGANVSFNLFSSELDLYAQAPTSFMPMDAGAGVLLSAMHTMPYVQIGSMGDDGSGFYTTQGFVWMARRPTDYSLLGEQGADAPDELRPSYWSPAVAYRTRGRRNMHLYVAGALGTAVEYDWRQESEGGLVRGGTQPVRMLMAGVVFQRLPVDLLPRLPFPFP
jgi:hypothetical protein